MNRRLGRLARATAAAVLGLGTLVVTAGTASAATPASSGAAVLMQSYNSGTGLIGNAWWTSAVALSTVMTYRQATGDTTYDYAISTAFNDQKSGNFENAYMDDTGWWALVWIQAYDITGNASYLQMAETDATYMHGYWDSTCNGGIWWSTAKSYKNAIANELFLQVTAAIHNRVPGDTTYLGWANSEWSWFNGSGMINGSHLINDGVTSGCGNNGQTVWTYNQGVILAGLGELYRATGNASLLTTATTLANASTISSLVKNGILTEPCEPGGCGADGPAFKGIYVRDLKAFATTAATSAYNTFLQAQSAAVIAHDTNGAGQFGLDWAGPVQNVNFSTQAGGEDALVAALTAPPANTASGPITSGIAGKCLDDASSSTTNGTKVDLWDCNGTGAQVWTVGGGAVKVNGKCLDVTGGGTGNGALVEIWDCTGGADQRWTVVNGTLVNPVSGRCLDDPGSSTTNGVQVQLWDCNGTAAQKWWPVITGPVTSGIAGKCLDDAGNGTANGTKIDLWDCNGTVAQRWTVNGSTAGINGKCLDVTSGGTANGTLVQLYDCNGTGAQKWQPSANGSLVNPASGKCLDDPGAGSTNGIQLDIWPCNAGANQRWTLSS
jgi:hypothetical protein